MSSRQSPRAVQHDRTPRHRAVTLLATALLLGACDPSDATDVPRASQLDGQPAADASGALDSLGQTVVKIENAAIFEQSEQEQLETSRRMARMALERDRSREVVLLVFVNPDAEGALLSYTWKLEGEELRLLGTVREG
jgi:hypothetical protein